MVATSRPYYRSTYMFVSRADANLSGLTLDDPRLKRLRIGVQMVGNDASNTPPAHALASRGVIGNVRGYMLYGDYSKPNPPAEVVRAVERGEVDVALVWGPLAGYFAARSPVPLRLEPVTPWFADMQWPMQFDISVGVQKDNQKLLKQIDQVLAQRSPEIRKLLAGYHVPLVER
jgi:mxaJ protein